MAALHVTQLRIHPVKGCRAIDVVSAEVDALGLAGDRRFLITDPNGRFLTQRSHPALARIETCLDADTLTLRCDGAGEVIVPRHDSHAPLVPVEIWKDQGLLAESCGQEAGAWLSHVLRMPVQLVRVGAAFDRRVRHSPSDAVAFADAYPLLVVTEGSLHHLNDRLVTRGAEALPVDRFRPNIVIGGADAHAEDGWPRLAIGNVVLRGATVCVRCIVTTTNQLTGERGVEPLRTLATYRRDPTDPQSILFGRNFVNESKRGVIRVGDLVEVRA